MSAATLRPQHVLPERGLRTHNTDTLLDVPEIKCCSLRSCRQGVNCPFVCKHCSATFCSEHASPHEHKCVAGSLGPDGTWTSPDDRQALVCDQCATVITKASVQRASLPPSVARAVEDVERRLREVRGELFQHVNAELHEIAVRGYNSDSFSCVALYKDEEQIRSSAPEALTQKIWQLERELNSLLLSAHVEAGVCGLKQRRGADADKCCFKRCKTKGFRQKCNKCGETFCLTHRLPEVHLCAASQVRSSVK